MTCPFQDERQGKKKKKTQKKDGRAIKDHIIHYLSSKS
jgi:hypothetical protein